MKISIYSLPRSATKHLQNMFQSYLVASGEPVLCKNRIEGAGEPFVYNDNDQEYSFSSRELIELTDDGLVYEKLKYKRYIPSDKILRADLLLNSELSWVIKSVPRNKYDPIIQTMITETDLCMAIIRRDLFSHALSFCLSKQINSWSREEIIEFNSIHKYTAEPIQIDTDLFLHTYKWFSDYNNVKWHKLMRVVEFETLTKIKTAEEFCDYFRIPLLKFNYIEFPIEYGDNKFNMISNLDELESIVT